MRARSRSPSSSCRSHRVALCAHALRAFPTWSERLLWSRLSGSQLGVAFRRQLVVGGRYVVDFAAPAVRLVVEIDGGYHARRQRADARRDRVLARLGWRVVRVSAEMVESDIEAAVAMMAAAVVGG